MAKTADLLSLAQLAQAKRLMAQTSLNAHQKALTQALSEEAAAQEAERLALDAWQSELDSRFMPELATGLATELITATAKAAASEQRVRVAEEDTGVAERQWRLADAQAEQTDTQARQGRREALNRREQRLLEEIEDRLLTSWRRS